MAMQSLVVFHMNGCPHCRTVVGEGGLCRGLDDLADVHEVEASDALCQAVGVRSFPTIVLVNPLFAFAFDGERTPEALRSFVLRKMAQTSGYLDEAGL